MIVCVNGLITRITPVGESDCYLTVITEKYGKISVFVKAYRSQRNRYIAALQLLCYSEFALYEKKDKFYLKEAAPLETFYSLRLSLEGTALGMYVAELANEFCLEGDAEKDNGILRLTLNTLYSISEQKKNPLLLKAAFELRIASVSGYKPNLLVCLQCGTNETKDWLFSIDDGALFCSSCRNRFSVISEEQRENYQRFPAFVLNGAILAAMRYVVYATPARLFAFSLEDEHLKLFSQICETYLLHHMERAPESLEFYKHTINI